MMARIATIDPQSSTGKAKTLLDAVQSKMKMVPNLMRVLASSPAALEGYLNFNEALSHGLLSGKLRELISVVVAEANGCEYCLSAHTAIGKMVGLKEEDILASRKFNSGDPKIDAALRFSRNLVSRRAGRLTRRRLKQCERLATATAKSQRSSRMSGSTHSQTILIMPFKPKSTSQRLI